MQAERFCWIWMYSKECKFALPHQIYCVQQKEMSSSASIWLHFTWTEYPVQKKNNVDNSSEILFGKRRHRLRRNAEKCTYDERTAATYIIMIIKVIVRWKSFFKSSFYLFVIFYVSSLLRVKLKTRCEVKFTSHRTSNCTFSPRNLFLVVNSCYCCLLWKLTHR